MSKKYPPSPPPSDLGTPELQARGIELGYNEEGHRVARVVNQRRIDTLYRRGTIDNTQFMAANALIRDAYYAGYAVYIKSSCNFTVTGKSGNDGVIDAIRRFNAARGMLKGHELAVVFRVVLDDMFLKDLAPKRSYRDELTEILRDALDTLAVFYGIVTKREK